MQSPERLKLLLILTVADIRAVGPKVWNGWKAALLRELYHRALELMSGGVVAAEGARRGPRRRKQAARELLKDFTDAEFEAFRRQDLSLLLAGFRSETQARHARLMREAERERRAAHRRYPRRFGHAVTEVVLYTADHPGLFSRIAGALALAGANIVDARILTHVERHGARHILDSGP